MFLTLQGKLRTCVCVCVCVCIFLLMLVAVLKLYVVYCIEGVVIAALCTATFSDIL